jgi:hypothetical protein
LQSLQHCHREKNICCSGLAELTLAPWAVWQHIRTLLFIATIFKEPWQAHEPVANADVYTMKHHHYKYNLLELFLTAPTHKILQSTYITSILFKDY